MWMIDSISQILGFVSVIADLYPKLNAVLDLLKEEAWLRLI